MAMGELEILLGWGSPIGLAIFFIGLGVFMGLFFWGIRQIGEAKK